MNQIVNHRGLHIDPNQNTETYLLRVFDEHGYIFSALVHCDGEMYYMGHAVEGDPVREKMERIAAPYNELVRELSDANKT